MSLFLGSEIKSRSTVWVRFVGHLLVYQIFGNSTECFMVINQVGGGTDCLSLTLRICFLYWTRDTKSRRPYEQEKLLDIYSNFQSVFWCIFVLVQLELLFFSTAILNHIIDVKFVQYLTYIFQSQGRMFSEFVFLSVSGGQR